MNQSILSILSAAGSTGEAPPAWMQFLPLVAMGVIFWFLILRPQMRRQKEHQAKLTTIKKGDEVLTGGGIVGKVMRVDDHYAEIEIANGVRVRALKSTIADVNPPAGAAAAND
ncbi:preprotein translocase subunit YajC [Novosphingobium album (ex Liu et al. 2023)]|uniref:Sec translocon accessory complex subunit YajC n=1 Tax=Novosphingobium album (ex Liu et al. 2023) TaxID=3031130 RepID=A0ABT5WPY0_9SPHN|nr:preprotein translocase subunit YajC [Novosphingobium album (ex Liu et al. 2023)]MDE8652104.1 preprotein translocase subunit YajC [Novosphingobium album (ex Liu et al. 2023)]